MNWTTTVLELLLLLKLEKINSNNNNNNNNNDNNNNNNNTFVGLNFWPTNFQFDHDFLRKLSYFFKIVIL